MSLHKSVRSIVVIAAALAAIGAGPMNRVEPPGGKERILTLTVWAYGTGRAQWNAELNDPRDGSPGTMVRKSDFSDSAIVSCLAKTRYRVVSIQDDEGGGMVELEKIDSLEPVFDVSGGGRYTDSDDYYPTFGGVESRKDQASWIYVPGGIEESWPGPELNFIKKSEFEINPPRLPIYGRSIKTVGRGVEEDRKAPRREYAENFKAEALRTLGEFEGHADSQDKDFKNKLRGRLDWSKRILVAGHASHSEMEKRPIGMANHGGKELYGGEGTFEAKLDVFWTVSDEPSTVEMDLIPQSGYERWRPRGGKDEKTPGSRFAVDIDIHESGRPGIAPDVDIKKLTVWLADTSRESGVCMNFPKVGKTIRSYDFRIRSADGWTVKKEGQGAEADKPEPKSTLVLDCYDYGGWTQVMATAELADGRTIVGRFKEGSGGVQLSVPKDENRNRIADAWERPGMSAEAASDADSLPRGNDVEGDGLSQYEEYRGFLCKGVHTRTDPVHKDLFIHDPGNLGIGLFHESGITVRFVGQGEFDQEAGFLNKNVINGNRSFATLGPQHLLILKHQNLGGALTGFSFGSGQPGPPRSTALIAVDVARCLAPGESGLAATIAHELGHGCNVWHHGETDYYAFDLEFFNEKSASWRFVDQGGLSWARIATTGGQISGVEECIMRYITGTTAAYEKPEGDLRWRIPLDPILKRGTWTPTREDHPKIFCAQREGTGINGPGNPGGPLAGDATKGECLHQFQVNDHRPVK